MSFAFKTKAQNLVQLQSIVKKSFVLKSVHFHVAEWLQDKERLISNIFSIFDATPLLIVRSSSLSEDSFESSLAGQFESVLNVKLERESIISAVESVLNSYREYETNINKFEVLLQPMLTEVKCSGVIFTRTLETLAPYYVINYDDTSFLTDTVTSGNYDDVKNILIYKFARFVPDYWSGLISAVKELENICSCDHLDIEFAINSSNQIVILQVRPIVTNIIRHHRWMDNKTIHQMTELRSFVSSKMTRKPQIYGETTIFGQMPDWNPAEIIGTRPKPLSYSLYNYLIMESSWRKGRQLIGYQTPHAYNLMVQIAGRPFVDVRASFNSLLPQGISPDLAEKLVNYYLKRLNQNPHYHDKIEFYIVHSCLDFSFEQMEGELLNSSFTNEEILELRLSLLKLTKDALKDQDGQLKKLLQQTKELEFRRRGWLIEDLQPLALLSSIDGLLKDTISFGTIPFSAFARCAFIGTQLMRSLIETGVWTEEEFHNFMNSIETVAGQYAQDMQSYAEGKTVLDEMIEAYGHLRPGTYDITTPRYDERPDIYFSSMECLTTGGERDNNFQFTAGQLEAIQKLLNNYEFGIDVGDMIQFVRLSIELREKIKFEFTKNVSLSLKYIKSFGEYYGMTADDMSFISVGQLLRWNQEAMPDDFVDLMKKIIEEQKFLYVGQAQFVIPDLIRSEDDLTIVRSLQSTPNFTSHQKIIAPSVAIKGLVEDTLDLKGKIVLIEQADPGYDWVFSKGIGGLVTKYGGVASHMAVRCAEFGIPAAIGCGEWLFQKLEKSKYIELNCPEKRVMPCEGYK